MSDLRWAGNSHLGRIVPEPVRCPKCKVGRVVYNGNYFCEFFAYPVTSQFDCDWALSNGDDGRPVGLRDRNVWKKIKDAVGLPEDA